MASRGKCVRESVSKEVKTENEDFHTSTAALGIVISCDKASLGRPHGQSATSDLRAQIVQTVTAV
eukprot:597579-Hanusia_phi.AAC.1